MKYIVTGGAGFIGSHIVDILIELGYDVTIIDNLSTGKEENINPKAKFIKLDLSETPQTEMNQYFSGVEAVFHCAALPNVQYSVNYPYDSSRANADTTIKVLESIRYNNISKIIYSSSSSVYGETIILPTPEDAPISPISPYALQKYIGEEYCYLYNRMYNINYIIFRYFNVYGPRMTDKGAYVSVLSHFIRSYTNKKPLNIVNNGEQKRDFVYVKDIAEANIKAAFSDVSNQIINLGSGVNISINTIASWFNCPIQYGEKRIEPFATLSNIKKAKDVLDWEPKQKLENWIHEYLRRL